MSRAWLPLVALVVASPAWAARGAGATVPTMPDTYGAEVIGAVPAEVWWTDFHDGTLDRLVAQALGDNLDLAAADDRVRQARALELQNLSGALPAITFDGSINGQPAALRFAAFSGSAADDVDGFYYQANVGFNAVWNLDIWGRSVLGTQAAFQDRRAAEDDADGAAVSLASAVVGAWYDLALADARLAVLEAQVATNRDLLEVVQMRLDRGEATAVEVLQQRQALAATQAQLAPIQASREVARQQLGVLVGADPASLPSPDTTLPEVGAPPATGRPDELLDHRPDLRAAERRLKSSWQRRMAAERGFLPSFSATANLGWNFTNNAGSEALFGSGNQTQDLFEQLQGFVQGFDPDFMFDFGDTTDDEPPGFQQWFSWSIGARMSFPIFNAGRNVASLQQARAAERAAAHSLGQAQRRAVAAVESAVVADRAQRDRLTAVGGQLEAADTAFEAARARYVDGVGDYLTVLSTLVARQNAEFQALQARRDVLSARINLHEALGGSWTRDLAGGAP